MAHSLSPECTPLKKEYDSCFNAWFEGYLEPAVAASASSAERAKYSKQKAEEYERNCGKIWGQYQECVQNAVKNRGLNDLLKQAREENPLREPPSSPPSDNSSSASLSSR